MSFLQRNVLTLPDVLTNCSVQHCLLFGKMSSHFQMCPPCPGLGFALCYTPAIAMVGCYFHQRKALAYGIAMSGSGIGTFVLAPAVQLLIELYSWRGALLVLSAFVANLCVCGALLRPITVQEGEEEAELEEEKPGEEQLQSSYRTINLCSLTSASPAAGNVSSQDAELAVKLSKESDASLRSASPSSLPLPPLLGNPAPQQQRRRCFGPWFLSSQEYRFLLLPDFLGLAVSFLFLASGCSLPFVYLVPYALSAAVSHHQAAFLMSILGVIDIVGNITFGWLTDRRYELKTSSQFKVSSPSDMLFVSQVSEAVPSGVLHRGGGDGGSLLPLHAAAPLLPAPRALRRPLRLLRRRLRGADPRGDWGRGGSLLPVLSAGRGLLPPRHPLPHQPADRRSESCSVN